MKITATASGGFTGRSERVELDTGGRADGQAIEALLADLLARLDYPGAAPADCVGADIRRWEISADDGRCCRTLVLAEDGGPAFAGWQALLAHLRTPPQGGA
jgi:hypothetical protein